MVRTIGTRWIYAALALLCLLPAGASAAQQGPVRYFDESGHNVGGAFLEFFEAHGGVAIFGYPITEAFEAPEGQTVQYFQRARFEWDEETQTVRLGKLGLELHPVARPRAREAFSPAGRYFFETGQAVGWEFRAFYEANGDQAIFGAPITGLLIEDERTVQYFERARFEWWYLETPVRPVRLTDLGTAVFLRSGLDRGQLASVPGPAGRPRMLTALRARASVARPVLGVEQEQTVFVHLVDQVGEAAARVRVYMICQFDGRTVFEGEMPATDARGLSTLTLRLDDAPPGEMVVVRVTAERDNMTATAETSFRVWW